MPDGEGGDEMLGVGVRETAISFAALVLASAPGCAFFSPGLTPGALEARIALPEPTREDALAGAVGSSATGGADPTRPAPEAATIALPTAAEIAAEPLPQTPPSRPLGLAEVLGFAEKLSPRLRAMREQVGRAEGARTVAFSGFLPEVDARYRHIQGTESFALPTSPTLVGNVAYAGESDRFRQAELAVQWVVWDFGRTPGRFGQSDAAFDIAELEYARARQTIQFDVTAAYFALLRAQAFRRIARQAVRTAESVLRDAENFLAQGTALREEVQRAQVQLAQMRLDLVSARTQEGIAIAGLNRSVGFHVASPTAIVDVAEEPSFERPLGECLGLAAEHRDELRVALRAIDSARLGLGAAQADFLPRVVAGGTGIHVDRAGPEIEENVFTGGVGIELALFRGGRRIGELTSADAEMRLAIARGEEMCDAIAFEVVSAYLLMDEARSRIRLGRLAVEHARENLRVEKELFRSGAATATDMVDAELVLIRSQQDYFDALYGYQTALARMVYATGTGRVVERDG
jgi:outer membrane protein